MAPGGVDEVHDVSTRVSDVLRPSDKTPPDVRNDLVSWHGPVPMFLSIAIGGPVSDLCIV